MNCFNHKDREAAAQCRFCGKGVCDECAVPLGKGRGTACSRECEQSARAGFRRADQRRRMAFAAYVVVTMVLTAALALAMERRGGPWLWLLLPFAAGAALVTWFFFFTWWHFCMWAWRGAPDRAGEAVRVTDGPHQGRKGEVVRLSAGSSTRVVVSLAVEGEPLTHHFDWEQLRKIRKPPPEKRR